MVTEHLSLYQLTIEPVTRFHTEAAAGRLVIPDGDAAADLFERRRSLTAAAACPPMKPPTMPGRARRAATT